MQPWRPSFATDYQERGNYPNPPAYTPTDQQLPYMYPPNPSPKPNYNRAAQPFMSPSTSASAQQQSASMHNTQPPNYPQNTSYPPHPQQQYNQDPAAAAYQMSLQQQQQYSRRNDQVTADNDDYFQDPYESMNQQRDAKREEPDMDEDFPSFKELRSVFLDKEKESDGAEKKPQRKVGKLGDSYKPSKPESYETPAEQRKPPPPLPKKPPQQQSYNQQQHQSQPHYSHIQKQQAEPKQQNVEKPPHHVNQQPQQETQFQPQQQSQRKKSFTQIKTSSRASVNNQQSQGPQTPTAHDQMDNQPYYPSTNGYREIPVHHISSTQPASSSWSPHQQNQQVHQTRSIVTRQEMGYRPPMSINVSNASDTYSYDSPSPRVVITSNSPRSPQKATYKPDDYDDLIVGRRRRHSVTISPNVTVMNSFDNQPRRRTSYAEITLSGANSLPRNFTMRQPGVIQRSVSQVSRRTIDQDDSEFYPGFNDVKQHFIQNEVQGHYPRNFGVVYGDHMSRSRNEPTQGGFTRVSMRRSSLQTTPTFMPSEQDMRQQQFGGWSATIHPSNSQYNPNIRVGPNVQYSSNTVHTGKSAAHLQYNSPMGLYSTANAQEALDRDTEAAKLLKIKGPHPNKKVIINSPTLQAVLREDMVKNYTGHNPDINFFYDHREYGPGIGPLRQYEEVPDTLCQSITTYNQAQDKTLTYRAWSDLQQS